MKTYAFMLYIIVTSVSPVASQFYLSELMNVHDTIPFITISDSINEKFDKNAMPKRGGFKIWKRMEWWASKHLDKNGKLVNIGLANMEALQEMQRQFPIDNSRSNSGQWYNIGYSVVANGGNTPRQGRVNCLAFSPNDPNIIYAGTAGGGIWKTTNNGTTWYNTSDNLPSLSISSITSNPSGQIMYALTGDGFNVNVYFHDGIGILKSYDYGQSWTNVRNISMESNFGGYKIRIRPSNENHVIASTSYGLMISQDAGATWTYAAYGAINDFEFKIGDDNILYFTTIGSGIIRSYNIATHSITTHSTIAPTMPVTRIEISLCQSSPNSIYALVGPSFNGGAGTPNGTQMYNGFYYSSDGGNTFTKRNDNLDVFAIFNDQSVYDNVITVDPTNPSTIVMSGVRTYKSTDGGFNFTLLNNGVNDLHGDSHALELNPLNGKLYLGDDGGVLQSTDFGTTWTNVTNQIVNNEVYRIHGSQSDVEKIICGTQDNGQFTRIGTTNIYYGGILGLDGMDNIIDYSDNNIMYACVQNGGLYKSYNGGISFTPSGNPANGGAWITPIEQSPTNPLTIFYGGNDGVFRSNDAGGAWINIGGVNGAAFMAINYDGTKQILYAGTSDAVYYTENPLASNPTWYALPLLPIMSSFNGICINPTNSNEIWLVCSGYTNNNKVYRTLDRGLTWYNFSLTIPNIPIHSIAYANNTNNPPGAVFIGTELGVFYKDDFHLDWNPYYNQLPIVPVTDLFVHYNTGTLTAATFGRGVWRTEGFNFCGASLNLSNNIYGHKFYQASEYIDSSQSMYGEYGNELKLRAGVRITLSNGFKALNGSHFKARIGYCGSGIP